MARAKDIPRQAEALVRLGWLEGAHDGPVAALAREKLPYYGQDAIPALRRALRDVDPQYQPEVVEALLATQRHVGMLFNPEYLVALEDAVWDGSRDARRLAIAEVSRYRAPTVLLPMIDAAVEDPDLKPDVVRALGRMGDDRARFWLAERLQQGDDRIRPQAAEALARIGGRALQPLREALGSDRRAVRLAAVRALLPVVTLEDLSALYEYYGNHADDDPETTEAVRATALRLELLLQQQQAADASSPAADR